MKVKIFDKIYDANEQPIMIILTEQDKKNIANMHPDATKYACFPDTGFEKEFIERWMKTEP